MAGSKNGVKTQILKEEHHALLFTVMAIPLISLSVGDTIKSVPMLRSNMDTTREISKLLKYSPKRQAQFNLIKADSSPNAIGFRNLCPTRWTVCNESYHSILYNYTTLLELWDVILEMPIDSDVRACVHGVSSQMQTFDYNFGTCLLYSVLQHTHNLSETMQHTK